MPELPDITVYIEALDKRILGQTLEHVRVVSPFLLRTATPPLGTATGKKPLRLRRVGKRICIGLECDLWLVLHLMIAGRLHWRARGVKISPPRGLAAFDFPVGSLLWTEAGSQKRAFSMWFRARPDFASWIPVALRFSSPTRCNSPPFCCPQITP